MSGLVAVAGAACGSATDSSACGRRNGRPLLARHRRPSGWALCRRRSAPLDSLRLRCLGHAAKRSGESSGRNGSAGERQAVVVPGHDYNPSRYSEQLQGKADRVARQFAFAGVSSWQLQPRRDTKLGAWPADLGSPEVVMEVHPSPVSHYRLRCRFGLSRESTGLTYVMGRERTRLTEFPVACHRINDLMPRLLEALSGSQEELSVGVREVQFLTTLAEPHDCIITLVYDRSEANLLRDTQAWQDAAAATGQSLGPNVSIAGKSRGVAEVAGTPWVTETLRLQDGRSLVYRQVMGAFTNPNGAINQSTLEWLCDVVKSSGADAEGGLLELYCGCGNHTVALAGCFEECMAVELNPRLAVVAEDNLKLNGVPNVQVVCGDSMDFSRKVLEDPSSVLPAAVVASMGASTVLVDPPRAGLDAATLRACSKFRHILYISCNQTTLQNALSKLVQTHTLQRMAMFDHFPYTDHTECGVYLRAR